MTHADLVEIARKATDQEVHPYLLAQALAAIWPVIEARVSQLNADTIMSGKYERGRIDACNEILAALRPLFLGEG